MKVIYLHGFASSGNSSKSDWLRQQFAGSGIDFISPDLPNKPRDAALFLDGYLAGFASEPLCLIGTSLGGFFSAFYAGKHDWPAVLINPLADMQDLIGSAMGQNENYATGESFTVDRADADQLIRMSESLRVSESPTLLLLDRGDELLDYNKAVARFGEHANVHAFEGGSHRFDHLSESMPEILKLLNK